METLLANYRMPETWGYDNNCKPCKPKVGDCVFWAIRDAQLAIKQCEMPNGKAAMVAFNPANLSILDLKNDQNEYDWFAVGNEKFQAVIKITVLETNVSGVDSAECLFRLELAKECQPFFNAKIPEVYGFVIEAIGDCEEDWNLPASFWIAAGAFEKAKWEIMGD